MIRLRFDSENGQGERVKEKKKKKATVSSISATNNKLLTIPKENSGGTEKELRSQMSCQGISMQRFGNAIREICMI